MNIIAKNSFILCVVTLASGLLCSSSRAATSEWQRESQKAFLLLNEDGLPGRAYEHYQRALSHFASSPANPIAIDLQLDMVKSLIDCKRYVDAKAILNRASPIILNSHKGTLLEARYWRRCASLHSQEESYKDAAADQRHVVELIGKTLGDDTTICIDERMILVDFLKNDHQWKSVFDQLAQCDLIIKNRKNDVNTARWNTSINILLAQFCARFKKIIDEKPQVSASLIAEFHKLRPDDSRQIDLLRDLMSNNRTTESQRTKIENQLIPILRSHRLDYKDADRILVVYLIKRALPGSFDSNGMTQNTIDEITEVNSIADRLVPVAVRDSSDLFIQAKSLKAAMLAQTGRPNDANVVLASLRFSPSYFKLITPLNGVLQARKEIAKAYVALGQRELAMKQFQAIYRLIRQINPPSKQADAIFTWTYQEKYYLVDRFSELSNPKNTKR